MTRSKAAALAALVLAGAVGAVAVANRMLAHVRPSSSVKSTRGPSSSGTARFIPGQERRYDLTFRTGIGQPDAGQRSVTMELTGQWVATVTGQAAQSYEVMYEVVEPQVSGGGVGPVSSDEVDALRRRLTRRFFVTYQPDGAATRIHFPRDMDPSTQNLLQMMTTETQLVLSAQSQAQWIATERDGAGSYMAAYRALVPGRIGKTKLRYLQADGMAGAKNPNSIEVGIEKSERRYSVDGDGRLVAFEGREDTTLDPKMGGTRLTVTVSMQLANLRLASVPGLVGSLARELPNLVSSPIVTHQPSPEQAQAQQDWRVMKEATFQELPSEVGPDHPHRDLTAAGLEAYLRQRPETIGAATEFIRRAGGAKVVSDALGAAGTPEAQAALCSLALDQLAPSRARKEALTSLVLVKHPTAEAFKTSGSLLDAKDAELRRAAVFMLGSLAHAGAQARQAEANAADVELSARYARAKEIPTRLDLLSALGNSASPATLPAIRSALADPNAQVRSAAARALRLVVDPVADELLAQTMEHDSEPRVRSAAIFAAGFREVGPPLLDALIRAAEKDPAETVRTDALTLLARHWNASHRIVNLFEAVAKNDLKPGIRRLASEALARHSQPAGKATAGR